MSYFSKFPKLNYDIKGDKAPVRSEEYIKSVFESEVDKLTPPPNEDLSTITLPPIGGSEDMSPVAQAPAFSESSITTDEITGTDSSIPFIEVISNPFLSIV